MELRVLGCHGGETKNHRSSSFLLDGVLGIDAGATASELTLQEQNAVRAVVVSHAHLDHVRDLAGLADNRCQTGTEPLIVAGSPGTLKALKQHFFNNILWPDFTVIPLPSGKGPTVVLKELPPEEVCDVAGYRVRTVLVSHTIESAAIVVETNEGAIAYSGDTGPTERLWQVLPQVQRLKAILMEVSFPNHLAWLAKVSGHHTPESLAKEMEKLSGPYSAANVPTLLYHIKPAFVSAVEKELAALHRNMLDVLSLGDELRL